MTRVILSRLLRLVLTLLAVTFLSFSMLALLPGDPVDVLLPPDANRSPELVAQMRADLHLDDPFLVRYWAWLSDALHGDLGHSYITGESVSGIISDRLPVTLQLALMSITMALIIAIPIGILGAYKQGKWPDTVTSAGVVVALSIPHFIFGILLIQIFAVQLGWLPASSWSRLTDAGLAANMKTAILPATAMALAELAIFARLVRSDMIATLRENYILTARSKGMSDKYILFRHALRPSSLSLLTVVGIALGGLIGGSVVIETMFAVPGIGFTLITAINSRDVITVQGITVFIATTYVLINAAVDLLYSVLNPRIRRS